MAIANHLVEARVDGLVLGRPMPPSACGLARLVLSEVIRRVSVDDFGTILARFTLEQAIGRRELLLIDVVTIGKESLSNRKFIHNALLVLPTETLARV